MHSWLKAAQYSLKDAYPEDALKALRVALTYCPKGSTEWSKVMKAIRYTHKAIAHMGDLS